MNKQFKSKIVLFAVFIFAIILPLLTLFLNVNLSEVKTLVASEHFGKLILNSLTTTLLSTIISVGLAVSVAWAINRANIKFKNVFTVLLTVPMLIPSISHAIGLIILLGSNGIITSLFGFEFALFGFNGIVLGSILYSFPVAFLLLNDAFSYEDYTVYEAASVLGLSPMAQFKEITFPNITKPMIAATFAVFTMVFTDYGVPLMIGGKFQTLSAYMYREIIGLLNFSNGAIIGVILLIPALVAFLIDLKTDDGGSSSTVTTKYIVQENKTRDIVFNTYIAVISIIVLLPILAFMVLSFVKQFPQDMSFSLNHFNSAKSLGITEYLLNSLTISLGVAILGTITSYLSAYVTARTGKDLSNRTLHFISMFSLAVPGVVLGLSYVLFFNGSILYNTVLILIIVNIVHFFSSPYLMAYNSLSTFSTTFNDISEIYNISSWKMLIDVYIPNTEKTIYEMFSYFFTNSMITISAVSFLSNVRNMPLALLIPQLDAQSLIEPTALVSLIILIVNVAFKIIIYYNQKNSMSVSQIGEINE
ncbi:MAG: ABC transporter permease subunit [Erysipelothrix sp.]|nr:ABC transporter permease subunit [Erysipelothrix sp.]